MVASSKLVDSAKPPELVRSVELGPASVHAGSVGCGELGNVSLGNIALGDTPHILAILIFRVSLALTVPKISVF